MRHLSISLFLPILLLCTLFTRCNTSPIKTASHKKNISFVNTRKAETDTALTLKKLPFITQEIDAPSYKKTDLNCSDSFLLDSTPHVTLDTTSYTLIKKKGKVSIKKFELPNRYLNYKWRKINKQRGLNLLNHKYQNIKTLNEDHNGGWANAFLQDADGNMLIGTTNGLFRYNGENLYELVLYDQKSAECKLWADKLHLDAKKNVWVFDNYAGILKFCGNKILQITNADSIRTSAIINMNQGYAFESLTGITNDDNGRVWISTALDGLFCFYDDHFEKYKITTPFELEGNVVQEGSFSMGGMNKVFEVQANLKFNQKLEAISNFNKHYLFLKYSGSAYFFDATTKTFYEPKSENPDLFKGREFTLQKPGGMWFLKKGKVMCADSKNVYEYDGIQGASQLATGNNGHVYCLSKSGLIYSIYKRNVSCTYVQPFQLDQTYPIYVDDASNVWTSFYFGSVIVYNGNRFQKYNDQNLLKNNMVWSMNASKNTFACCDFKQVYFIKGKSCITVTNKTNNMTASALNADNDAFYFDLVNKQYRFKDKAVTEIKIEDEKKNNFNKGFIFNNRGDFVIGTVGGIYYSYENHFYKYVDTTVLKHNWVEVRATDRNNNFISGNYGSGIFVLNKTKVGYYPFKSIRYRGSFFAVYPLASGRFSFAVLNSDHLAFYDNETFYSSSFLKDYFNFDSTYQCHGDNHQRIWVSKHNNLFCFDGSTIKSYTILNDSLSNEIKGLVVDDKERIWVANTNTMKCLLPQKNDSSKLFAVNFDGFDNFDLKNITKVVMDGQGELWISSSKGVGHVNTREIGFSTQGPKVHLEEINVDGKSLRYAFTKNKNLTFENKRQEMVDVRVNEELNAYGLPKSFTVSSTGNEIDFEFAGIDLFAQNKTMYAYRLKGQNDFWSDWSFENKAHFTNLAPGNYLFKVKCRNEVAKEGNICEYAFEILPPWHQTWWFRILMGMLAILLIYIIIKWRTLTLLKKQKQLEHTIEERTTEIRHQRDEIEEKNKEITDSIAYAKRLQSAILPPVTELDSFFENYFLLYLPKDIVAGDFYWGEKIGNNIYFAIADCTGHGVPGAMVSVVCANALSRSVNEFELKNTGEILDKTRTLLIETFKKSGESIRDGMDVSLFCFDTANGKMRWSGANNGLWIIRKGTLIEHDPDAQPVGLMDNMKAFTQHEITLEKNDMIYMTTDGFADQFGGEKGKKFKTANLKRILLAMAGDDLQTQKNRIEETFVTWKGIYEQTDDISLFGWRI